MNVLFIGGDWNDEGGRKSGYCRQFIESLVGRIPNAKYSVTHLNGGHFGYLETIVCKKEFLSEYDYIFWFANVPNDKPKLIREIKKLNPTCMLITSKANLDKKYTIQDLIGRALENKANLLVEFTKPSNVICSTVIDPLGNEWYSGDDITGAVVHILTRLCHLRDYTRMESIKVMDEALPVPSDQTCFYGVINKCADKFHELIHGANTSRMLGNASFRCENGFPSMRYGDLIYVSKRNIDKRDLGANGFVACEAHSLASRSSVMYAGDHKPSVDTPVQLALYNYFTEINYMIHSHVYVKDAPFTSEKIPCGALEEAAAIISVYPWHDIEHFAINLKGHGSIICGEAVFELELYTDRYIARPMPERT